MSSITITYKEEDYTLEFTRRIVKNMERNGFNLQAIDSMPTIQIGKLIHGAFMKNHKQITEDDAITIFESTADTEGLLKAIVEMYSQTVGFLVDDTSGEEQKEKTWKIND